MWVRLVGSMLCMTLCSIADAQPDVAPETVVVVGRVGDGVWSDGPTQARLDQPRKLAVVVLGHRGRERVVLAPDGIDRVTIAGRVQKTQKLDGARVQWSTVEPHGFREHPATNGATETFYTNVSTSHDKTFGRWLGFDHIDYFERVVQPWSATSVIDAVVSSGEPGAQQVAGLGTVRYKAEVELAGVTLASPGAEATDTYGMLPKVHRVTVRKSDDFLGQLGGYLLVPEVFGSAGEGRNHQTERYTGGDCADILVGAARRAGKPLAYTNVAGLPAYTRQVAGAVDLDEHGVPSKPITGVKPGDLVRIDFGGDLRGATPRDWDHVGALWEDRSDPNGPFHGGPDGQLDGFDLVIHMGHPRLIIEPLASHAPATVDVLRWR